MQVMKTRQKVRLIIGIACITLLLGSVVNFILAVQSGCQRVPGNFCNVTEWQTGAITMLMVSFALSAIMVSIIRRLN